jgi:hypothetical protein
MADELTKRIYPVTCPECQHISHKALLELIHCAHPPCEACRAPINLAREYGKARLEEILLGVGRRGYTIPDVKEFG